ncbi:hypothetical protein GYMLUDRAFT_252919 [Collybiopsis luxurians FD-317 M1]|uniref:Uncharacterized protein n=1 Tax=Collybiopsis luxurians FD-317 M1 TaxID=944289 RepID=A0A0D0AK45_9AGAR|nr:hypothetical protein GYMLUDRAFT_252919 [Collybiopsis luxurians FD-317 M1]
MDHHYDYEAARTELDAIISNIHAEQSTATSDTSSDFSCLGVCQTPQSFCLIPLKEGRYYKLGWVDNNAEKDIVFASFKI